MMRTNNAPFAHTIRWLYDTSYTTTRIPRQHDDNECRMTDKPAATHFSGPTTVDDDTSLICDDGFWHSQRVYVDEQIVSIYTATVRCIQLTTSDVVLSSALYMTRHQRVSSPSCTLFYYRTMLRRARPSVRPFYVGPWRRGIVITQVGIPSRELFSKFYDLFYHDTLMSRTDFVNFAVFTVSHYWTVRSCCQACWRCTSKSDPSDLLRSTRRCPAMFRLEACPRPTSYHLDSADLPRHGSYGDRRPAAGRRPIVLATNRNGGKLQLNASRTGRKDSINDLESHLKVNQGRWFWHQ